MMNVAVGRLHLSITFEQPARVQQHESALPSADGLERAFQRDRMARQVESDRELWSRHHRRGNSYPF